MAKREKKATPVRQVTKLQLKMAIGHIANEQAADLCRWASESPEEIANFIFTSVKELKGTDWMERNVKSVG